jgi:hypothetical protein
MQTPDDAWPGIDYKRSRQHEASKGRRLLAPSQRLPFRQDPTGFHRLDTFGSDKIAERR